MIYVINYQSGNLGAITNMFKRIGVEVRIAEKPHDLNKATKIVLPGVGTFDTGMQNLMQGGWLDILNEKVLKVGIPTIGICLGMQLLTRSSEEGKLKGLGWIPGETKRFSFDDKTLKIPHMGWNRASIAKSSKLFQASTSEEKRFYFAHAYFVEVENEEHILLRTQYGISFTSAVEKDNILGVQFHPEKSHRFGMELLKSFSEKY